jgi:hypothetical protein
MPHSKSVIECLKTGKNENCFPNDTHHRGEKKRKKCKVCFFEKQNAHSLAKKEAFFFSKQPL